MSFESKLSHIEQYLRKLSGQEKELNLVDHNYPKAWNSYPDSHRMKPARMLFMKEIPRNTNFHDNRYYEEVDAVSCDEATPTPFDNQKIKYSATECEDLLKSLPFFADKENKTDVDMQYLSEKQLQLYTDVMDVVNALSLSRFVHLNSSNEFVKRKIMIDQAAAQMRQIFAEVFWEEELVTWVHQTLLNDSDFSIVISYVNILQRMMQEIPSLIEKLVQSHSRTKDILLAIIRKQWEPVLPVVSQHKLKKLPRNPAFVICPSGPTAANGHAPRMQFWNNYFNSLGKIVNVPIFPSNGDSFMTVEQCLDHIILSLRSKVSELKNHYPEKPLILVGWTIGALIACHVALLEQVDAVICLGFPLTGVNGSRGDLTDPLLDNHAPTLFVVGQNANMCSTDDIEDFRSRMQAESGLIVVGGADDFLRMNSMKMMLEGITQTMVDYCISEEVADFLHSVFAKLPQTSAPQTMGKVCSPIKEEKSKSSEVQEGEKRRRRKPREYSPEIFPARKKAKISQTVSRTHSTSGAHGKTVESDTDSSSSVPDAPPKNFRASKNVKKKHDKNAGRSGSGVWRRKVTSKTKASSKVEDHSGKVTKPKQEYSDPVVNPKKSANSKSSLPFSKQISSKKNDPVDVEKAFGNDSRFLPRPLTPQEPEDTVSAEETEKVMAEMEAKGKLPAGESSVTLTDASELNSSPEKNDKGNPSPNSAGPLVFTSASTAGLAPKTESKITAVAPVSNFGNVLQEDKTLSPSILQSLKMAGPVNVSEIKRQGHQSQTKSTIITIPSVNAAKLLASSPSIKAQPGKMIQLLSKANIPVNIVRHDPAIASTSANFGEASDQYAHSFIPDRMASAASPKEVVKKVTFPSPLARLAIGGESHSQLGNKVFQTHTKTHPSHVRVETAEEIAEKNLAVQALSNSFGSDFPSTSSGESGYSICYAKPDGSVISHTVTGPGYVHYLSKNTIGNPGTKSQRGAMGHNQTIAKKIFRYNK